MKVNHVLQLEIKHESLKVAKNSENNLVLLNLVSIKCFSDRNKAELFARANAVAFCRFS